MSWESDERFISYKQIIAPFCHSSEVEESLTVSEISRDVIRIRRPRSASGLPVYLAASLALDSRLRSTGQQTNAEAVSYLRLRLDCHFGLYRISNETLLVRGMIHLLELLLSRLFFAGELQSLV